MYIFMRIIVYDMYKLLLVRWDASVNINEAPFELNVKYEQIRKNKKLEMWTISAYFN